MASRMGAGRHVGSAMEAARVIEAVRVWALHNWLIRHGAILMGPIEQAVRKACRDREQEPLAEMAFQLSRTLDLGVEDKAVAGLNRELRLTLDALGVAVTGTKEAGVADELRAQRAKRRADAKAQ